MNVTTYVVNKVLIRPKTRMTPMRCGSGGNQMLSASKCLEALAIF